MDPRLKIGIGAGALVALLFAPKTGKQLRKDLRRGYDDALADAQRSGYAEPDPTFDVTGRDAAQKIAVLASVAWARWRPERDVFCREVNPADGDVYKAELFHGRLMISWTSAAPWAAPMCCTPRSCWTAPRPRRRSPSWTAPSR